MSGAGRLSVIMPVYNEENTILAVAGQVLTRPETGELIIVNDASTDSTAEKLRELQDIPGVKIINQERNCGKGAALIRGIDAASLDFVLIQDADMEYSPEDYPAVLAPLLAGKADVVYGSRFMSVPGEVRCFRHEMGNKFLTLISNIFSDLHLTDMETCYKCFRREVVQNLKLDSCRFGIEVEFTAKLAKSGHLRIWEVPVSYAPRRYAEGKKITWKDGIAAIWHIIRYNVFTSAQESIKRPWDEILKRK